MKKYEELRYLKRQLADHLNFQPTAEDVEIVAHELMEFLSTELRSFQKDPFVTSTMIGHGLRTVEVHLIKDYPAANYWKGQWAKADLTKEGEIFIHHGGDEPLSHDDFDILRVL